ncbi:MAG: NAD-dependent epimerase/dehydratase family protein, partial [Candidatus Nanohaloarchaea archaeon]|nr:NAD-dependent epimerase/dehydratase family protein [Candidatus Nanohaloarchaea archaeon]
MAILVTGADGYVGFPTTLKLAKEHPDERIVGVDNLARRQWVGECGSLSAVPIEEPEKRFDKAKEKYPNISFVQGDLTNRGFVNQMLDTYEPRTIVHLAAQPSAPYSQINGERACYTQHNNNEATRNLLWGVEENGLDPHFIESTTMGVYGAPEFPIPEGFMEVERGGGKDRVPFPGMAGSWYHQSKSNDVNNLWLANKQFGLDISDFRMGIVYGTRTEELEETGMNTRFDFDYYFGTVINRFCAQAVAGYPITVYGKGEQRKPMISLKDTVQSFVNAVDRKDGFQVYNQTTRPISIVEVAETIAEEAQDLGLDTEVKHYENPRDEKEEHKMEVDNDKFMEVLGKQKQKLHSGISDILKQLKKQRRRIKSHKDRFLPSVLSEK